MRLYANETRKQFKVRYPFRVQVDVIRKERHYISVRHKRSYIECARSTFAYSRVAEKIVRP